MTIEITALRPQDRDRWHVLARGYKTFYDTVLTDAEYDRMWERLMTGDRVFGFGANLDGELVGITHFLFHASAWMDDVCYLQDIFVDPGVRGRGVARALIERVAQVARERGAPRLYWQTRANNAVARALYDKLAKNQGFIRYDYPMG